MKRYKDIAGDGGSNIAGQVEAQHDPHDARLHHASATDTDPVHGEIEAADPIDHAVGKVRASGETEPVHQGDGRNREPHFERTSARSSLVIVVSPRPRA